jgi:4-amino-4-deoxy-L-arabinose transferase-like glycosyltransferase
MAVLVTALAVRLAFLSDDPPLLLTTDSITYARPAMQLALGQGFDVGLRRTPGYPLFLASLWSAFGPNAWPILFAQHLLGLVTAGVTWQLGRLAYGRLAGLLGGLAVALAGPQLLYEHYLMTETLFTFLLALGLLAAVAGLRRSSGLLLLVSGLVFGLCALTRPLGQLFPLVLPAAVLLGAAGGASWRIRLHQAGRVTALVLVGYAMIALPWMLRNRLVGGELTGSSALGRTLFGRITRHDDGFRFDLPPAGPVEPDPQRAEARALARQAAQDDTSRGSLVQERLSREYGYGEAETLNIMRDVALDIILSQPDYYILSSLRGTVELFLGQEEPIRVHLDRLDNERLRRDWQLRPELASLLPDPVPLDVRRQTLGRASWAIRLYQPSADRVAPLLGLLLLLGAAATLIRPVWRAALPIPLLIILIITLSAFLDGAVPRFRYPVDPAIGLVAAAGLLMVVQWASVVIGSQWIRPRRGPLVGASPAGTGGDTDPGPVATSARLPLSAPGARSERIEGSG